MHVRVSLSLKLSYQQTLWCCRCRQKKTI